MSTNKSTLLLGLQFGDEGKNQMIDYLMKEGFNCVIRFNGSENNDHNIEENILHKAVKHVPSGIFHSNVLNIITDGVVLNLHTLKDDIEHVKKVSGFSQLKLSVSHNCTLIMPWHILLDSPSSIAKGTGPAMADRMNRRGIRLCNLYDEGFKHVFYNEAAYQNKIIALHGLQPINIAKAYAGLMEDFTYIAPYIEDTYLLLQEQIEDKACLFEGAHGYMLDIFNGTYPYVATTICDPSSIFHGTGMHVDVRTIGLFKPYVTRIDNGQIPTEADDETKNKIVTKEHSFSTNSKRVGWLDIPMLKFALQCGVDDLALMHLDALTGLDQIYVCTKYIDVHKDEEVLYHPGSDASLKEITKFYEIFAGWNKDLATIDLYKNLPSEAKEFIEQLEILLEKKIRYIGSGIDSPHLIVR